MSDDDEVTIAGRVFGLGVVYAPAAGIRFSELAQQIRTGR
jgi:hypothetical protein